jgi:hypothetical protein
VPGGPFSLRPPNEAADTKHQSGNSKNDDYGSSECEKRRYEVCQGVLANSESQIGQSECSNPDKGQECWRKRMNGWLITALHVADTSTSPGLAALASHAVAAIGRHSGARKLDPLASGRLEAHIRNMATIVKCDCGAEYRRTDEKFLVPHTGHASCKVCGATLESWIESTHVAIFELVKRPDVASDLLEGVAHKTRWMGFASYGRIYL